MMRNKEKYLLVASFLEGKNFPRRLKTQFFVEAKFDGEQLSTDPVEHSEELEINQELAWELDKKALQQHRLQRSVIKINCFALTHDSKKENVGYFVLDIRSAPDYVGKPKWYMLLQSKYSKLKPEIRVNLYVEDDQQNAAAGSTISGEQQQQPNKPARDTKIVSVDSPYKGGGEIDSRKLRPFLVESEGYFQIGPESHNSETFVLSITILYARNLVKLTPSNFNFATNGTFFFSYVLMNSRILTEVFNNILTSQINAERASIRVHATLDILKAYLSNHTPIEIYLCANDSILLGKANLNISNLVKQESFDLNAKPIVIDEVLELHSVNQQKQQQGDDSPSIGIQVILRKENFVVDELANKPAAQQNVSKVEVASGVKFLHDESTPMKANHSQTPNLTPIKSSRNDNRIEIDSREHEEDRFLRTPSPTHPTQQDTVTKVISVQQVNTAAPPVSARHHFSETVERREQPAHMENAFSEELQLRAAYEIQMWKEAREKEFDQYLKALEAKKLQELAEAFKHRDKEREIIVQKKVKEYSDLEAKLKSALTEVDKRERALAVNETSVSRIRVDLQREYELKLNELREASKRVQEQAEHHLALQRSKCESLEEEIQRLKRNLLEAEKRHADKESEFMRYKEKESSKPEVRLQSEINMLTIDKNGLERKLETAIKSKNHYKEQWIKALQEIAALKRREEANAKTLLKKQQIELDHLRLRYLAAEENSLMKTDERQLESLKNDLNKLKTNNSSSSNEDIKSSLEDIDSNLEEHIHRLIEERDTLLKTGVYSNKDSIIIELDRKIREAMNQVRK